jgi:hypothetical protein
MRSGRRFSMLGSASGALRAAETWNQDRQQHLQGGKSIDLVIHDQNQGGSAAADGGIIGLPTNSITAPPGHGSDASSALQMPRRGLAPALTMPGALSQNG